MGQSKTILLEKLREALSSVLPIVLIVLVLCFSIAPIPTATLMTFLIGAVLLIGGMGLFTLGADQAMTPIGERVGAAMTRSRKLWIVVSVSFLIGVIVTVSEPDLQVLATQVPGVPNPVLIDIGHAHANGWDLRHVMEALQDKIISYHVHNNDGVHDCHQRIYNGTLDFNDFLYDVRELTPKADLVLEYAPDVAADQAGILKDVKTLCQFRETV